MTQSIAPDVAAGSGPEAPHIPSPRRRRLTAGFGYPFRVFRRSPLVAGITIALLAIAGSVTFALTRSSAPSTTGPTLTTTLVSASQGTMRQTVSSSGTIAPADQSNVNFTVSGQVTSVKVSEGDRVKKGQILARVDSASLSASVAEARATVASDEARVSADESSSTTTSAQLAADQAALSSARNQLADAQSSLHDATLRSPITGTVTTVNLTVGQQVSGSGSNSNLNGASASSSSQSTTSSSAQIVVVSTDRFIVNATVDDTQVQQLKKGLQVTITPSNSTKAVYGTISSIGLVPSSTSGTVEFPVVVDVTGKQTGLYGGSSATLSILVKQLTNVLQVPSRAISYSGSTAQVTVDANGSRSTRTIKVGLTVDGYTQVLSGLKAGDKVVTTTIRLPGRTGTTNNGTFPGGGGGFPDGGGGFPSDGNLPGGGAVFQGGGG